MATTLSARAVGSTVTLEVDGSSRTFRVVHQGNPDPDLYDASCDGTWLLLDDLYATRSWGSAGSYPDSDLHAWLNETFLALLDTSVQAAVKSVRLPYWDRSAGAFQTGADGFEVVSGIREDFKFLAFGIAVQLTLYLFAQCCQ